MPQILMPYTVQMDNTLRVTPLSTLFANGDNAAHKFALTILCGGVHDDLNGCTVKCKFYRMAESTVVKMDGTVEDGKAVVVLDKACYDYTGRFTLTISIKQGEANTTVFYGDGYMHGQSADTAITGEYIVYDIDTLIEKLAEIDAATEAANTATARANTATGKANTAATNANNAASAANTAASGASGWANATMTATALASGSAPTATVTTASDGHKVITLGIPRGNTGATPQISVEVQTGAAGSEAAVSVTGTAENPVIHLTIPRGDMGNIGSLTINGKTPDASGTVTLGISDISGLTDELANAGGVKTVAGVRPDSAGNVALNAESVGALDASGTAADSAKLGGKAPEYYIRPRNLLDNSDFTNPVNQRGETEYSNVSYTYTIDRWKTLDAGTVTVNDGYITTTNHLVQFMPKTLNGVYTAAAKMLDGTILIASGSISGTGSIGDGETIQAGTESDTLSYFALRKTGSYIWAALYEGSYTADTLPPYVPKGYAAELAECRRYYKVIDVNVAPWLIEGETLRRYYVGYEPMRIVPTVDVSRLKEYNAWTNLASTMDLYNINTNRILISAITQITSTKLYIGGSIALSADL